MSDIKKVVLAYSGGLDTSIILKWLIDTYDCEVVAYAADLGQGEELDPIEQKGLDTGACQVIIDDLKEEFVADYVFPAFRAGAIYESQYLLGTSLARPIIALGQVRAARDTGSDAVSHGATGKGNDQVRFELGYQALAPELKIIAPWREWDLNSREALMAYAKKHGIPVPVTKAKPYSSDRNLLHISFEGGILEDPWTAPPEDMFVLSVSPQAAPDQPQEISIEFDKGDAISLDGEKLTPAALLAKLNELGGKHGIGRVDLVENRYVGMKSRGVYETPGGTILRQAHLAMESLCLDREVLRVRDNLLPHYSELIYYGYWFSPEMELLQSLMDKAQEPVCGEVRLQLYKGNVMVLGRRSPNSLYRVDIATFEEDSVYDQADATGFIQLNGLRLRIRHALEQAKNTSD
jgi:argininosuccinate synthase